MVREVDDSSPAATLEPTTNKLYTSMEPACCTAPTDRHAHTHLAPESAKHLPHIGHTLVVILQL